MDGREDATDDIFLVCAELARLVAKGCSIEAVKKEDWVVKLTLRENESIQEAVRRFRKLVERSGIKKEMRRREYYEKPSEIKRRARLRAERRSRRTRLLQNM